MGVYCASKAALASMTEVWRYELQAWGINVSMIIPSGYKTGTEIPLLPWLQDTLYSLKSRMTVLPVYVSRQLLFNSTVRYITTQTGPRKPVVDSMSTQHSVTINF